MSSNNQPKFNVSTGVSGMAMAESMFGDGIKIVSATYTGDKDSGGIYSNGLLASPGVVPSDSGVIMSTGRVDRFVNNSGEHNQYTDVSRDTNGIDNNLDMNHIAGIKTFDGAFFDAKFVPDGDTLTMRLVFGSEEYLEWVNSGYNDAVGVWVNGVKQTLSIGDGDVSIDNINLTSNSNLFRDNTHDAFNTEMDGVTLVLTIKAPVHAGQVNDIRIGIADAGDAVYDSALLIVADSVQTALIAHDDALAVTTKGETVVNLMDNDITTGRTGVVISHLNDVAVSVGDTITLATGEVLRLNADYSVTVLATTATEPVTFSYTITDSTGTADAAFVTIQPSPVDGTSGNDGMHVNYRDADGNIIDGADGNSEAIFGYAGNDKITAGLGDDDIYGGTGNDFVRAGEGNDLLDGGAGSDVLDGQAGDDTMIGGAGNDVYYIDAAGDVIQESPNQGYDKVISSLSHTLAADFEELWLKEGSTATKAIGNASDNKIVGNSNDNTIQGLGGNDRLFGEDGADSMRGGVGKDLIYGGRGVDVLFGEDGNDKLYGGAGKDSLNGGEGDDKLLAGDGGGNLEGGAGRDYLVGGDGSDTFEFATGSGRDMIRNYVIGEDHLHLAGVSADDVHLRASGTSLIVTWGTSDSITLKHIDHPQDVTVDSLGLLF